MCALASPAPFLGDQGTHLCALVSLGRAANNMLREASIQPIVRLKGSHWSEMNLTRAKDLTPTGARLHSRIGQPFIDYNKHPKSLF